MFLKLAGRLCLVVGAGSVAESKIEGLLPTGARIRVVAPQATPGIAAWAAQGRLSWEQRKFQTADLDGAFLVISATSSPQVNAAVFRAAEARGVLCNAVDEPERCHFYYPAVVRRGRLQIAISTGGLSPSLARRLRIELEKRFGPEYGPWLEWLGEARRALLAKPLPPPRRRVLLERLAAQPNFRRFARPSREAAS
jgi:precorrin-2 dehydrogenase/sirohydrochlorin ferrochelatase